MFECKQFYPLDLKHIQLREFERIRLNRDQVIMLMDRGQIQTAFHEGKIMMIFGFYHVFARVIEVFMIPSVHLCEAPVTVIKELKRFLEGLERLPIHRIQTLALADDATDKWMEALRFTQEGTLSKYTDDGLNFRMWARVK